MSYALGLVPAVATVKMGILFKFYSLFCCNGCKETTISYIVGFVFPSNKIRVFNIANGKQWLGRRKKNLFFPIWATVTFCSFTVIAAAFIQHYLGLEIRFMCKALT